MERTQTEHAMDAVSASQAGSAAEKLTVLEIAANRALHSAVTFLMFPLGPGGWRETAPIPLSRYEGVSWIGRLRTSLRLRPDNANPASMSVNTAEPPLSRIPVRSGQRGSRRSETRYAPGGNWS